MTERGDFAPRAPSDPTGRSRAARPLESVQFVCGWPPLQIAGIIGIECLMKEHQSHIWLGLFGPEAPETYFVQKWVDDEPLQSQFGVEQEQRHFDYDFVEISFPNEPRPIRELVDGHSYYESYIDAVVKKATELGITQANVFVLADKNQFDRPRSVSGASYNLWYLGEFACRR